MSTKKVSENGYTLEDIKDINVLYETVTGSVSYGTSLDAVEVLDADGKAVLSTASDVDRKGIYLPTFEQTMSLVGGYYETITLHDPEDLEYHALDKFLKLSAYRQNPTSIEMLFTDDRFVTKEHELFGRVREIRDTFLTTHCKVTFAGYARDQLVRIKNTLDVITQEESEAHIKYVLERVVDTSRDRYDVFALDTDNVLQVNDVGFKSNGKLGVSLDVRVTNGSFDQIYGMLSEVNTTVKGHNKAKNRNRKASKEKLWKHAMHLVRLLTMGIEIASGEGVHVYRTKDREMLLDIRKGKLTWDEFFAYADELFKKLDEIDASIHLPSTVDHEKISKVYTEILREVYLK